MPWFYKTIILVAVGLSLFSTLRRYHFQFQPYQIRYSEDSTWLLATDKENFQTVEILPSSVITSWLIVLHFRLENGKLQNSVILHDALSDKDYRTLLVTLKIAGLRQDNT